MCARERLKFDGNEEKSVETVHQITLRVKGLIESSFDRVSVQGELSGGKIYSSGHYYGALKDENAKLNLTIWRSMIARIPFDLEEGMQVIAHGKIEIYPKNGAYSLIADRIEPMGQGALDLAFRQICDRLRSQGLFEEARKREIPFFPKRVAVITSVSGAALRDFWRVAKERWPLTDIVVFDSLVQGDQAAAKLTSALRLASTMGEFDLIVLTRGGGSREDLWPFNDEKLAYAIAASPVPVVSAVGHEVDTSVSDLVADFRAATPTHAALTIFPQVREVYQQIDQLELQLTKSLEQRMMLAGKRVDELDRRLTAAGSRIVERASAQVTQMQSRLDFSIQNELKRRVSDVQRQAAVLESLSPLKVLGRGFSVTLSADGKRVVRSVSDMNPDDLIETRLADGRVLSRVESVNREV